jgi:hypothetical protein
MGLCMCCATIIGTLVLTSMARDRRRRLTRQEIWGNLGTEEGVDALLQTTWKYRGDIMEVYNRGQLGYRDDDSILMGGFQQTEGLCAE